MNSASCSSPLSGCTNPTDSPQEVVSSSALSTNPLNVPAALLSSTVVVPSSTLPAR